MVGSRFAGRIAHMRPHRRARQPACSRWLLSLVARPPASPTARAATGPSRAAAAADAEIVHDFNYAQVLTLDLLGKGYRYAEVPIRYRFREHGRSFVRLGPTCGGWSPPSTAS